MKKSFNVNGTKFTVDVKVTTDDYYNTIQSDFKKIMYLLGEVSKIGAKLDSEFTVRELTIAKRNNLFRWGQLAQLSTEELYNELEESGCEQPIEPLNFTTSQKNNLKETLDSTLWWFDTFKKILDK